MAKSIYGFAEAVQGGGSGVTEAIRLYNRAISQAANEQGVIDNPDIYRQARDAYLAPFADDVRVSTKISDSTNDENQLRDKINDVGLVSSVFKENVNEVLRDYSKTYFNNPQNLVLTTSYVYNTAVEELATEIENRKVAGQSVGELQTLLNDYSRKADQMARLSRQSLTGSVQNPNAYGWFIKTNPDDGSIVDITLDAVDSTQRQTGYSQTDSVYGQIPVWTNTITKPNGGGVEEVARIGANEFTFDSEKGVLVRAKKNQFGRRLASFLPGGETPGEAAAAIKSDRTNLDLSSVNFGDVLKLPTGSIMKDAAGTYYYQGQDGVYKATSKDNLQRYLNVSGITVPDVDAQAFPISRNEAAGFGAFTNEDGTSRIIDDSMFNDSLSTPQQQSFLPSLDSKVTGRFSTTPTPLSTAVTPDAPVGGGQQPRKPYSVKAPTQIGLADTRDVIASEGRKFTSPIGIA